jgi:hypothetical protein
VNRLRPTAAAVALAMLAIAPAAASAQAPVVRTGHSVAIFHNLDFVSATGYAVGTPLRVDVLRGPHRIGTAHGITVGTATGPGLEINHGTEGTARQGDCWDRLTPDVRPGDEIVVTDDGGQDTVFVDTIRIDEVVAGTAAGDENVYVRGVARYADGTPIPPELLDSGEVRANGGGTRANPTQPVKRIGDPAGDAWEAVYEAPTYGVFRGTASKAAILTGVHAMGYGHLPVPPPPVIQVVDGPETPGPALGCETLAPAAPASAIMAADDEAINLTSGDLSLSGVAAATVTGLDVTLTTASATVTARPAAVSLTSEAGGRAWTATFTRAQLEQLGDGTVTATATFAGAATTTHSRSIVKDLAAPPVPVADPPAGTYASGPLVRFSTGNPDDVVRFTRDGSQPTLTSPTAAGFVRVATTQTLTAFAIDSAGNTSPAQAFAYVIADPPAAPPADAPAVVPPPSAPAPAPLAILAEPSPAPALRPLKVSSLSVTPRIGRARVRREGIRALMRVPAGTEVVRLRVYKRSGTTRRLISSRFVVPRAPGLLRVRLHDPVLRGRLVAGRYQLEVTPGTARDALGSPARAAFTVSASR